MLFKFTNLVFCFAFFTVYAEVEEGIYEANPSGKAAFLQSIEEADGPVIAAAYKINPGSKPDQDILKAFNSLKKRHLKCEVILESRLSKEEKRSPANGNLEEILKAYTDTGAILISDLKQYQNVHLKTLLTDKILMVSTTNYDDENVSSIKRDFSVVIKAPELRQEFATALRTAIDGEKIKVANYAITDVKPEQTRLTWGPEQHKKHIINLIGYAKESIQIYQQDLQDKDVKDALLAKVKDGVKVQIIMSKYPFGAKHGNKSLPNLQELAEAGAEIKLTGDVIYPNGLTVHVHAKTFVADREIAYIGSANAYPAVLNPDSNNLNVGIITKVKAFIEPLVNVFNQDWQAHPLTSFITEAELKVA